MGDIRSLSEYLRRLNARLVCPNAYRKRFLSEAQRMADDYRQGNLDASDEEVIEFLGDPQELAATFLDSIDSDSEQMTKTGCIRRMHPVSYTHLCLCFWFNFPGNYIK